MNTCPTCQQKKAKYQQIKNEHFMYCSQCKTMNPMNLSFLLPKSFDASKVEPIGVVSLPITGESNGWGNRTWSQFTVFLLRYNRQIVYVPDMPLLQLKTIHPSLLFLFEQWAPFRLTTEDKKSPANFSNLYFRHMKRSVPSYSIRRNQTLYNLLTYNNRQKDNTYHLVYKTAVTKDNETLLSEHLFRGKTYVSSYIQLRTDYRHMTYKQDRRLYILDSWNNQVYSTSNIDSILTISDNYVVGYETFEYRDEYKYRLKVLEKESGTIVYQEPSRHEDVSHFRLIGNRYFAIESFSDGAIDLYTGKTIPYPFGNRCERFISNVYQNGFEDETGWHPTSELPDLGWTGFDMTTFLSLFNGFIPDKYREGRLHFNQTGWYEDHQEAVLLFQDAKEGVFYKDGSYLINLATQKSFIVNNDMMRWIQRNPFVHVFDEQPKSLSSFSILEPLKNGKSLFGIHFVGGTLVTISRKRPLKTNFLKKEIQFDKQQVTDIMCHIRNNEPTIEITTNINGQQVTFETDKSYEVFEVAKIS